MLKKIIVILFIICFSIPAFAKKREEENIITPMVQLEKRIYQTRNYKSEDKAILMKAMLSTLQDEGYIVYNANSLLGYIYASKDYNVTKLDEDLLKVFEHTKSRMRYNGVKVATIDFVANFTDFGDELRLRVNFKRKLFNEYGNAQFIDDVADEAYYQDFFAKFDKVYFLLKQKI